MTLSTIEHAYALARSGKYSTVAQLKEQLNEDGCRAVDRLLSPRSIHRHLEAICAAASNRPAPPAEPGESE
ncbi:hypothetical protein [Caulobacter sp. NIBR2454]|uniref:hypothetical protein n=1 Tax=Caulobacter sp. NIBR2454 TaxID=3015996 RepID=UPI0022B64902|nr:hypothetical protein [Caulobacter sp. NIBR2454]